MSKDINLGIYLKGADKVNQELKQVGKTGVTSGKDVKAGFLAANAGAIALTAGVAAATAAVYKLADVYKTAINKSLQYSDAIKGLSNRLKTYGIDQDKAMRSLKAFTKDGLISFTTAAQTMKTLLGTGIGLPKTLDFMRKLKDQVVYNREGTLSLNDAFLRTAQGVKALNSQLTDSSGVQTNVSTILEMHKNKLEGLIGVERTRKEQLIVINALAKEMAESEGDAKEATRGWKGMVAGFNTEMDKMYTKIGSSITQSQGMIAAFKAVGEMVLGVAGKIASMTAALVGLVNEYNDARRLKAGAGNFTDMWGEKTKDIRFSKAVKQVEARMRLRTGQTDLQGIQLNAAEVKYLRSQGLDASDVPQVGGSMQRGKTDWEIRKDQVWWGAKELAYMGGTSLALGAVAPGLKAWGLARNTRLEGEAASVLKGFARPGWASKGINTVIEGSQALGSGFASSFKSLWGGLVTGPTEQFFAEKEARSELGGLLNKFKKIKPDVTFSDIEGSVFKNINGYDEELMGNLMNQYDSTGLHLDWLMGEERNAVKEAMKAPAGYLAAGAGGVAAYQYYKSDPLAMGRPTMSDIYKELAASTPHKKSAELGDPFGQGVFDAARGVFTGMVSGGLDLYNITNQAIVDKAFRDLNSKGSKRSGSRGSFLPSVGMSGDMGMGYMMQSLMGSPLQSFMRQGQLDRGLSMGTQMSALQGGMGMGGSLDGIMEETASMYDDLTTSVDDYLAKEKENMEYMKKIEEEEQKRRDQREAEINNIGNSFSNMFSDVLMGITKIDDGFKAFFKSLLKQLLQKNIMKGLSGSGGLFKFLGPIGHLMGFAEGGEVPGPIGAPQLAIVHGGEEVLTPEQRTHRNTVININISGGGGGIADELLRALRFNPELKSALGLA